MEGYMGIESAAYGNQIDKCGVWQCFCVGRTTLLTPMLMRTTAVTQDLRYLASRNESGPLLSWAHVNSYISAVGYIVWDTGI